MAKAKELYISLRDDPDLSIPEGESRESAAWNETSHRMRQHQSNSKALSMANETTSPVEKLALFTANQDFSRPNVLESLDILLMKANGSAEVNNAFRRLARHIHPDINKHEESFGDEEDWKSFHTDAMTDVNKINDSNRSDSSKMRAFENARESFNENKENEFPDWADANASADQDAKDAAYDSAQQEEWDAEDAAETARKEAEDTANTNRQNAEKAKREKAAADAAAASAKQERENAEESKKAQANEDAKTAAREAKEAEDAYNAAQEAQATADKEADDAAQAETKRKDKNKKARERRKARKESEEPKAEEAEPQSEDTSSGDASNEETPSDDAKSEEDSNPENEHGVSHALHAHIGEWFKELNNRHGANTNDAASSFKSMKEYLGMKVAKNELTKEDLQGIQEHFSNHPSDEKHLRENWVDSDGNSKWNDDLHTEYTSHQPSSESSGGGEGGGEEGSSGGAGGAGASGASGDGGDQGNDNAGYKKTPEEERADNVKEIIDRHEAVIQQEYENVYGEDNPDHSFEEYKSDIAKKAGKSDNNFSAFKRDRAKKMHTYNQGQEKAEKKAETDARDKQVKDLQDRAAGNKDLKMSKAEAQALIDEHGDADTAFDAHEKAFTDKAKKQESANKLPYTTDELAKKIFGDIDPTSNLTHLSNDRKKNKFGDVSTSLARELIAHYKTHSGGMDKKVEAELVEQLAFLKDPSKRFPNMKIPKGETIGADIKAANDMVNEAEKKGYDLNGPEAGRLYEKRETERARRVQHHQTSHVNPDSKEKKEASHGEGADASDPDERKGVFSETDNTSFIEFHEKGHPKAGQPKSRKRLHPSGGEHHENFKDDGSDDHHLRGDHEAKGSPVKEHIVPSHGSNLTNKEKASIDSLKEAHKAKATAERSGDTAASAKADEDIAQHTQDLTAGDMGLKESDFLHDEDDIPTVGPPDPKIAAEQRAKGLEWNEAISHWVRRDKHDERTEANGSSFSHVGDGASMGIETATMGADGVVTSTPSPQSFIHTNKGQYHAVDPTHDSIPSTNAGVQAQKFGQSKIIREGASNAGANGKASKIASVVHSHLTAHGASAGPKADVFERAGGAAKGAAKAAAGAAKGAASFAGRLIGLKKLVEEESGNLSAVQSLQLHIALQKLEEKQKIAV